MKQHNRVPAATSHETRGRVEAATIAAVSNPCRLVGDGASRDQLGQVAEILRRIEAQMSSLKCDLAGRLQRTDGGAGAGEVLRDQLGMTNHGPSLPTPGEEMSHPFSNVEAMKQHNHIPAPTAPQEICGWAEAANAAAVAGLRRLVGDGASREQLGRAAETLRRMEAQMSSLKCDLAGRLQRTDGGAGAGEVLRDQLGMTNHGAKSLPQVSRRLEEMPNTRAKLQTGEITLATDAPLPSYTGGKNCHTPFLRWTL